MGGRNADSGAAERSVSTRGGGRRAAVFRTDARVIVGRGQDAEQSLERSEIAQFGGRERLLHFVVARNEGRIMSAHQRGGLLERLGLVLQASPPPLVPGRKLDVG